MSFAHVQGAGTFPGTVTTATVTLGAAPTTKNIVCVAINLATAVTALTIHDGNSNSYTITPNSPQSSAGGGNTYLAYLLSAPGNATAAITASWTTAAPCSMWADEFSWSGTAPVFDQDVIGTGTAVTANLPSVTPTYSGSLLYSGCGSGGTITAPTAGGTLGVWTGATGGVLDGDMAEYDLSATGATAVQYTQNASNQWSAMVMAFGQPAPAGAARFPVLWMG
jgi:hypothetical protein